jgi:hypothetical protein
MIDFIILFMIIAFLLGLVTGYKLTYFNRPSQEELDKLQEKINELYKDAMKTRQSLIKKEIK